MSTIAETPELILPEYQSVFISERKKPLMTKSCDNIYSGPSFQGSGMKNKARSMLCLLTEYYTTKLNSLENGPLEKVSRGCFIRIPKGFQNIGDGVSFQLTLGNCLELLKLARRKSVPELLKAVYTLISDNYLNVLKNSAIYGQLTGLEREKILQLRTRGKLSLCVIETQSIFGLNKNISRLENMSSDQPVDQIYSLDGESNQWQRVTNIPEEACLKGCSICSMHNYLFIAGGIQNTKNGLFCSNKLFCYNPLTDIWTQLTPMNQARSQLKLVPLDGYLYAIGGECLQTMERYDPRFNKWTFLAPLPKGSFAVAHEAAACGGEIYISGGHLFYRLLKYNPVQNQWEECPFNASKGRSCDMVAVGHILYRFDMHKDSRIHILQYNTTAKVWSEYIATFPNSKVPFKCSVLDGTIYCLNRETTARFLVEGEKATFESTMFNKVPSKGVGYHCPVVLNLQSPLSQTSV
ncbi:kelch domain-containing protein 7B-like [Anomaloglossus baeobatrachus]|uniref:kelch domain-containing protein 7B-like n=1 Tax=Anomaloglossus baeobatrachus TaxID=238106 RepID=UPI003F4F6763